MNTQTDCKPSQPYVLFLACFAVICTQSGITLYSPALPFLPRVFGVSYTEVAYTFTAYILGYAIAMLIGGGISDELGRRRTYLLTTALFTFTSLMLIFTESIYLFVVLRLIQGIGGGGCAIIARASVRDIYNGKKLVSAMSYISIAFHGSMGIFQYIGGIIQTYANYKLDFVFMFCLGLIIFLAILFKFDETHYQSKNKVDIKNIVNSYSRIIKEKRLILIALGGGIGYAIVLIYNVLGIYYLQEKLHISPSTIGTVGIYFSAAFLLGSFTVNQLLKVFEINFLMSLGKYIIFIAAILMLVSAAVDASSLLSITAPLLLGLYGQAILYPCAMTCALLPYKHSPGAASSLFGFTQQLSGFGLSLLAGWLPYNSLYSLSVLMLIIGFTSVILLIGQKVTPDRN